MNGRRRLVLAVLAAGAAGAVRAQAARTYRVAYFGNGLAPPDRMPPAALRQALHELGYDEGRNLRFVSRWADLEFERLPALAREIVDAGPDVIVAFGYPAAAAARAATSVIPIVVASAGDPAAMGLVASLAHPGGNVTGVSDQSPELSAKRLELLKEVRPAASRIAVLWNAQNPAMTRRYQQIERAAAELHIAVIPLGVREPGDFDRAFARIADERPDALFLVTDALTRANQGRVLEFAARQDVPAIYEFAAIARAGGLLSYGPRADEDLRRVAVYVDRILRGAKPADLPVEQPTQFELVLNQKTARTLGLAFPQSLLLRADEVVR